MTCDIGDKAVTTRGDRHASRDKTDMLTLDMVHHNLTFTKKSTRNLPQADHDYILSFLICYISRAITVIGNEMCV